MNYKERMQKRDREERANDVAKANAGILFSTICTGVLIAVFVAIKIMS